MGTCELLEESPDGCHAFVDANSIELRLTSGLRDVDPTDEGDK